MAVGYIADVHIGNHQAHGGPAVAGINRRCRIALDTLACAVNAAKHDGARNLLVLGDVYDNVRPLPQVETEVRAALNCARGEGVGILVGNHDRNSGLPGDHALGPLRYSDSLKIIGSPMNMGGLGCLPFQPAPVQEWLASAIEQLLRTGPSVHTLCVHFGLHDSTMRAANKWMETAPDAAPVEWVHEVMSKYEVKQLFAGNWHEYKQWPGAGIVQVGALCPTGWDNPGLDGYGSLIIQREYEAPVFRHERIEIAGPRFITIRESAELEALAPKFGQNKVFVRWVAKPGDAAEALRKLQYDALDYGLAGFEVVLDTEHVRQAAHQAATQARQLDRLSDVAAEYVGGLVLPPAARREEVLRRVRGYLGS